MNTDKFINLNEALQARPEYLNEKIDDHDKSVYAQGWNRCNDEMYVNLTGLKPTIISKGKEATPESRLTQDGYNYCDGCNSTEDCAYFAGQTDVKCGDAAMYDRLREYEQIGCSPRVIENMLFAVKGE